MKPLENLRIVEFATVGGIPFCGWLFAQHGAKIVRIVNPRRPELGVQIDPGADLGSWNRVELVLDLKTETGRNAALEQIDNADILLEGFRPGVMERLGLDPATCHQRNPGLIYARLIGWDRNGPWAHRAGHDINYFGMSGALHAMGSQAPPLNLVADLGGGAMYAAFGIMAALQARTNTNRGSVVDTAMTSGSTHLLTNTYARLAVGAWNDEPNANVLDGGTPWYRCYKTSDGRYMAVGAIEERFYQAFVKGLGLDLSTLPERTDAKSWPTLLSIFASYFQSASLAHWSRVFESLEACVTPVLTLHEAREHAVTCSSFDKHSTIPTPHAVPDINFI